MIGFLWSYRWAQSCILQEALMSLNFYCIRLMDVMLWLILADYQEIFFKKRTHWLNSDKACSGSNSAGGTCLAVSALNCLCCLSSCALLAAMTCIISVPGGAPPDTELNN